MGKYKALSVLVFLLALLITIAQLFSILKHLQEPSSPGPDPYYKVAESVGYYTVCALFLWLSYWLFKKAWQLWNKER